jgi:putative urate catabolism protein
VADWYPRDLRGHGRRRPDPRWPGDARVALSFVLNVEEGGERSPLDGDPTFETHLHDLPGAAARPGARHTGVESLFDYGARAGLWRLLRLFERHGLPLTAFAVGRALERIPEAGAALAELGHEVAGHGWRWIDYREVPEEVERDHMRRTVAAIEETTGRRPVGWYTGRVSPSTRRLLVEEGGFLYDSDSYADDLPFWVRVGEAAHLVVPYSLVTNDMRCVTAPGVATGEDLFGLLRDAFDLLWEEGDEAPAMMSLGLHPRISGQPARAAGIARFLDHVAGRDRVWVCRRRDIAEHWIREHGPPPGGGEGLPPNAPRSRDPS